MRGYVLIHQPIDKVVQPLEAVSGNTNARRCILVYEKQQRRVAPGLPRPRIVLETERISTKRFAQSRKDISFRNGGTRQILVSTGPVVVSSLPYPLNAIWIDPQTWKVYIFIRGESGFQSIELGYYNDFCGETDFILSETEPLGAVYADRWLNLTTLRMYTYTIDDDSQPIWAEIGPVSGICPEDGITFGNTSPQSPEEGDRWFSNTTGIVYTYVDDLWIEFFE